MTVFRITLKSLPRIAQAADARATEDNIRLRQLLKIALRRFGFRCVNIEQIEAEQAKGQE